MSEFLAAPEQGRPTDGHSLVKGTEVSLAAAGKFLNGQGYGPLAQDEGESLAVTLRQYLYMVLKRKWLILSVVTVFGVLGSVLTFMKTPLYTATVKIQIEREPTKIVEGGATTPVEAGSSDFLKTQYELIKSRAMGERVASSLRLAGDENFFEPRNKSFLSFLTSRRERTLPSPQALESLAASIVSANVTIVPVPGSRLADISYLDPNPGRAQRIANGYADAYIEANLDRRIEANSFAKRFLEDQIKQLKIRLEESENLVLGFAEREKMVEVTDKASIAENNLAAANAAAGQLISERMKNEQVWRQVSGITAINLPQFLANPVIEVLRGQRKALETEYQEKNESFRPDYPAMIQIRNKLQEIDRQLGAEVNAIRASLKGAYGRRCPRKMR